MEMRMVPNTYISDEGLIQKFIGEEYNNKTLSAPGEHTLMF